MFCPNCGKQLNKSSKFCPTCGWEIIVRSTGAQAMNISPVISSAKQMETADSNPDEEKNKLVFYSMSLGRLFILSIFTIGIFQIYWFIKNWELIRKQRDLNIAPFWRGVFSIFYCHDLFKKIFTSARANGYDTQITPKAGILTAIYIICSLFIYGAGRATPAVQSDVVGYFFVFVILFILSLIPILIVQKAVNFNNSVMVRDYQINNSFTGKEVAVIIVGIVLFVLTMLGWLSEYSNFEQASNVTPKEALSKTSDANKYSPPSDFEETPKNKSITKVSQNTIAASIVNILCQNTDGSGSGGSGSIVSSNGLILTNNHIIPEDRNNNPTVSSCLVTLPDPETGKIDRVYQAEPIVISGLSEKYDLAFMNINSTYTDENGTTYGDYPTTFTNIVDSGCENDYPKLGEEVKVYGYPAISGGGYYLTITDGIVSSLPNDGTIVTSAKVDHGSSGGLAVDGNGCYIGVPSMISGDGNESLGILISDQIVGEFLGKVGSLVNKNNYSQ